MRFFHTALNADLKIKSVGLFSVQGVSIQFQPQHTLVRHTVFTWHLCCELIPVSGVNVWLRTHFLLFVYCKVIYQKYLFWLSIPRTIVLSFDFWYRYVVIFGESVVFSLIYYWPVADIGISILSFPDMKTIFRGCNAEKDAWHELQWLHSHCNLLSSATLSELHQPRNIDLNCLRDRGQKCVWFKIRRLDTAM